MNHLTRCFGIVTIFLCIGSVSLSQSFEGKITYKLEAFNPMPDKVPDSVWQAQIKEIYGPKGYVLQDYYYKDNYYRSEFNMLGSNGVQSFNPEDGLLYSWTVGTDSAITVDSKKNMNAFVEVIPNEEVEEIMGVQCTSITVKTALGSMKLFFKKGYLPMDPEIYAEHIYGSWNEILKYTGCLPLKMEQTGFMTHIVQTAVSIEEKTIPQSRFEIPQFRKVITNPIN